MSRFFNLVLAVLLMSLLILPSFAGGFGGGFSRSSSFSSSGGFTSTRSFSSSFSKPSSSFSFSKPTPIKTSSYSSPVKSYTPKTVSYTPPKTVKVVTRTRYVSNPTVVHHYSSGDNTLNTIATFALLNSISHSGNSVDSNRLKESLRRDYRDIQEKLLNCYDNHGGRACVIKTMSRYINN